MTTNNAELVELVTQLLKASSKKSFGYNQGLLAAIFIADALKAGGVDKSRLKLGTMKITVYKNKAGEKLSQVWPSAFGESRKGLLPHHVLLLDAFIVDPVISALNKEETLGIYEQGPPAFYGPITSQAIYAK
jgi:hypothetical protein